MAALLAGSLHVLLKQRPVWQPSERVVPGHEGQSFFDRPPLRHVLECGHPAAGAHGLAGDRDYTAIRQVTKRQLLLDVDRDTDVLAKNGGSCRPGRGLPEHFGEALIVNR